MKFIYKILSALILCSVLFGCRSHQAGQQPDNALVITLDAKATAQTIDNFGAAGSWYSEGIGRHWPQEKKERIAELLFTKQTNEQGNPKGIGLSAWRFNIGGGTTEQGEQSGIRDVNRRVESFLNPDGTYDWSKQPGYRWFLQRAKDYGVEQLIAFSNTPPVQFTQNGLGFKTEKDFRANLQPDKYDAFAGFLTEVIKHFDAQGLHFSYISPINEPQWDWIGVPGQAKQEGSPWRNDEMHRMITALNTSLEQKQLQSKILLPEAATLTYLYGASGGASRQVQQFFDPKSKLYLGNLKHVPKLVAGHSYFTDTGDSATIAIRRHVADTVKHYGVEFWQSEYSMLGDGFREGTKDRRSAMDCGLFLAKLIHHDITEGNATAWQFWNAYEPGRAAFDTRYYLIALQPNADFTDGEFSDTKNLWALGHYSYFVRPGARRLLVQRSDKATAEAAAQQVMVSAYQNTDGKMVLVAVNYLAREQPLQLNLRNFRSSGKASRYVTTAAENENLKAYPAQSLKEGFTLPPRSITTIVME